MEPNGNTTIVLWSDKKRTIFGLPLSFTRYTLTEDKLLISFGFLNKREEEIRLYRISDVTLRRTFGERILGLGTIHCCSSDPTTPEFNIVRIKNSQKVKELLSDRAEHERDARLERMGRFGVPPRDIV
ncbi:MAG: PH domain-containing protein [Clostridia bacterium]|nr:PH domain-containing protein [Christensenellaceae bacterium]MBR6239589.1 PH domain-containing protein [Clostridia bacterium]